MSLCSVCYEQHKMADPILLGLIVFSMMTVGQTNVPKYKLNNGREMPAIALGTYLGHDKSGMVRSVNKQLRDVVMQAIDVGYRHFDTAEIYGTEEELGEGVRRKMEEGAVRREELFITDKLWNTHHKREQVVPSLRESLCKMGLSYIDLFLMHWPMGLHEDYTHSDVDFMETWLGLEDAVRLGLARNIGVSNFNKQQLERILREGSIRPAALQIEVDRNVVPVTKTVNPSRLKENIDIFDFELSAREIEIINKFDEKTRYTLPSFWQTHAYYPFEKVDNPSADPFIKH
nr:aldo-keto reductase AKR2E4-like isoform X4 [Danaus plexippus plexippus]